MAEIVRTKFYLKGVCSSDLNEDFDSFYYVKGVRNDRPYVRGISHSHMYFDSGLKTWVLKSLRHPENGFVLDQNMRHRIPFGTHLWKPLSKTSHCLAKEDQEVALTISACEETQFVCDSGHCINLDKKCNVHRDCNDGSDEVNCDLIKWKLSNSYKAEVAPYGTPLKIFISANILAFPSIDTIGLKFTADFFLNLRWYDPRLHWKNLQDEYTVNALDDANKFSVWTPRLSFENALGNIITELDKSTLLFILKESQPRLDEHYEPKHGRFSY